LHVCLWLAQVMSESEVPAPEAAADAGAAAAEAAAGAGTAMPSEADADAAASAAVATEANAPEAAAVAVDAAAEDAAADKAVDAAAQVAATGDVVVEEKHGAEAGAVGAAAADEAGATEAVGPEAVASPEADSSVVAPALEADAAATPGASEVAPAPDSPDVLEEPSAGEAAVGAASEAAAGVDAVSGESAATASAMEVDEQGAVEDMGIPAPETATMVIDTEDLVDDIVPLVSYDDKRCQFSKDGRYILPKREQFPSIFCALRVTVRLEALEGDAGRSPSELSPVDLEQLLCEELGLGGSVAHVEDARPSNSSSGSKDSQVREIIAALSAALPGGCEVGSALKVERMGVVATIVGVTETCDDVDPDRITAVADCFREAGEGADAIAFELPQFWIILDPDFKAKSASIGLYPGSYWMGFFKCWGAVKEAEIYFRTVQHKSIEPVLHLVVQFRDRQSLKMCFTYLHDRYLAHPKLEQGVRPPCCRIVGFQDFKDKATASAKNAEKKGAARTIGRAKIAGSPAAKGLPRTPMSAGKARMLAKAAPGSAAAAGASAALAAASSLQARSPKSGLAPMTPMTPMTPKSGRRPLVKARPGTAPPTPALAAGAGGDDRPLSPAEVMDGLSGRQLEVFQMVMTRMERLEKENQELMQILLQMQGLLQQQQQRNARLSQAAGVPGSVGQAAPTLPPPLPGLTPAAPMGTWRQLPEQGHSGDKRKAQHLSPEDAAQMGPAGENAPWKAQRRRHKRIRGAVTATAAAGGASAVTNPALTASAAGGHALSLPVLLPVVADVAAAGSEGGGVAAGAGFAAYNDALLGV